MTTAIQSRMKNPAMIVPEVMKALMALGAAVTKAGMPARTGELLSLRASQLNGCSFCVDMHARDLKKAGETDARLFAVAAWRDAPYFTDAERAALAFTEAVTRLEGQDPVPDAVWEEAARHFEGQALAALVLHVALINFWNRTNIPTRQVAGVLPY